MGRLFGTDGVRGVANRELTAELAMALCGRLLAALAAPAGSGAPVRGHRSRPAGQRGDAGAAVIAGVTSEGVDALVVGVLPTPAVAYLTAAYHADFG